MQIELAYGKRQLKAKKANVFLYSKLDPETFISAHLEPVSNINSLILELVEKYGPDTRICVLPEGPHTFPYLT